MFCPLLMPLTCSCQALRWHPHLHDLPFRAYSALCGSYCCQTWPWAQLLFLPPVAPSSSPVQAPLSVDPLNVSYPQGFASALFWLSVLSLKPSPLLPGFNWYQYEEYLGRYISWLTFLSSRPVCPISWASSFRWPRGFWNSTCGRQPLFSFCISFFSEWNTIFIQASWKPGFSQVSLLFSSWIFFVLFISTALR